MISIRPIGSVRSSELLENSDGHVVFVLESDALRADALDLIESALDDAPDLVIAYGNESWESPSGRVPVRSWKPVWSPERLRGHDFVGFPVVMSRSLLRLVGGMRTELGSLALYDLVLRASERAERVIRIPDVLHHTSQQRSWGSSRDEQERAARQRVIQDHLDRVGMDAVARTDSTWQTRIDRKLLERPLVSIIIPTAGTVKRVWGRDSVLVENCVRSVLDRSSYSNFEIVVVHDVSTADEDLVDNLRSLAGDRIRCVPFTGEFNFSEKINRGVIKSCGEVVILLNDDTLVASPGWIEELLAHLQDPDVGIVGPMLLLSDGRIQSAGHFFSDGASHVAAGYSKDELGPEFELAVAAERSGITMACAAIRRDAFDQVGGLSVDLPRAYNDVDFCNKLAAGGFRMVWTPWVELYHFESLSRDPTVSAFEIEQLGHRWETLCYSPDEYLPHFDMRLAGLNYVVEENPTFVGARASSSTPRENPEGRSGGRRARLRRALIGLSLGILLAACAVLAGWAMRPSELSYADLIGVQDLPVVWAAAPESAVLELASGFIEREAVLEDGAVVVEGWLRVTAWPFSLEVVGSTPIRNAAGFSFLRADLPSAEGARAFSIVFELDSEGPVPFCLTAMLGHDRQRLSTPSCP